MITYHITYVEATWAGGIESPPRVALPQHALYVRSKNFVATTEYESHASNAWRLTSDPRPNTRGRRRSMQEEQILCIQICTPSVPY